MAKSGLEKELEKQRKESGKQRKENEKIAKDQERQTRKAVGTIKAIFENVAGSLIATGALAALSQLPNLFP